MTMLDRVKRMTSLVINVPSDIEKLSVIIETKTATAESALKREAAALEKAVTPELEAALEELEAHLSHIPGLAGLVKAHDIVASTEASMQTVVESVAEKAYHAVEAALTPAVPAAPAAAASTSAAPSIL